MVNLFYVRKKKLVLAAMVMSVFMIMSCSARQKQVRQLTSEDYYEQAQQNIAKGKYKEARENLEEARNVFRSGDLNAKLLSSLGNVHYRLKEYQEAIEVYQEFLKLHPRNALASQVQYQIGMSYFQMVEPKDRDPEPAYLALSAFLKVVENYPRSSLARQASQRIESCQNVLAERELFVGKFYFKKKNYLGAIGRFETVIQHHSNTSFEEDALYYLGEAYKRLEDEERAREYFLLLLDRYPGSKYYENVRSFLDKRSG